MRKIAGRWSQCEVSVRRSCHGLDVLDGFILPVWCGVEALEPLAPRNGHLARHRPVAGVLLDERVSGVNSVYENVSKFTPRSGPSTARIGVRMACRKTLEPFFEATRKNARQSRVYSAQRRMLCFSSSAL